EPGVPVATALRPVDGPAVIGASAFAPRGLAPAFPAGDIRLTHAGRTVGWVVGPGSTWTRPSDAGPALEVAGLVLRGVFDLVPALERLLGAELATRLEGGDAIPRGSTVIGEPAWLALHATAVEPGVVFDTAAGPITAGPSTGRSAVTTGTPGSRNPARCGSAKMAVVSAPTNASQLSRTSAAPTRSSDRGRMPANGAQAGVGSGSSRCRVCVTAAAPVPSGGPRGRSASPG